MFLCYRVHLVLTFLCPFLAAAASLDTDAGKEEFLRSAKPGDLRTIETGVTGSLRAMLTDGSVSHEAHIQRIHRFTPAHAAPDDDGKLLDSYLHNVAAYRIDRLIGLNVVPVSVVRNALGARAAFTWWVDDATMTTAEFHKQDLRPPDPHDWNHQFQAILVLQELVYNRDPNKGNLLVTRDWRLRPVDFSRSFSPRRALRQPEYLTHVCPALLKGLESLTEGKVKDAVGDLLRGSEVRAIIARRDLLLAHAAKLDRLTKGMALECVRPSRTLLAGKR